MKVTPEPRSPTWNGDEQIYTDTEHLWVGQKPVTVEVIESILAKDIDELEPRLTRHGYNAKVLAEVLNAKPREIHALLRGQLAPGRVQELQREMLAVGISL